MKLLFAVAVGGVDTGAAGGFAFPNLPEGDYENFRWTDVAALGEH